MCSFNKTKAGIAGLHFMVGNARFLPWPAATDSPPPLAYSSSMIVSRTTSSMVVMPS